MAIDTETRGSPGWWMQKLWDKLEPRRRHYQQLFDRYEGEAPMPKSLEAAPETAKQFFKTSRTRFAEMIVKSVAYPLRLRSVATGLESGSRGDAEAWDLVRRSGMEYESKAVQRTALVAGRSFAIVSNYRQYGPRYTSEDPREVVTIQDPVVQSETIAAMKITHDSLAEQDYCYLFLPGLVFRASKDSSAANVMPTFNADAFDWDPEYGGENGTEVEELPDEVPVIPYRDEEGVGEFERHLDLLDRIDHMVLQGMVIATYQAFKQRGIKVDPEDMPSIDPETGDEIDYDEVFSADPGALWRLPESAEMWESGAVDLTPVWTGIDRDIQKLSAVTFTPLAMFSPEGANQSAEGANFARESRTFKVEDRQEMFGNSHEKALSLLLRLDGQGERAELGKLKIAWKPAERYSLAAKSAAMSHTRGDLPFRTRVLEIWQASPEEADEMEMLREREQLLAAAMETDPTAMAGGIEPTVAALEDPVRTRRRTSLDGGVTEDNDVND